MNACIHGDISIVKELLKCSDIDILIQNAYGQTALMISIENRRKMAIKILIDYSNRTREIILKDYICDDIIGVINSFYCSMKFLFSNKKYKIVAH